MFLTCTIYSRSTLSTFSFFFFNDTATTEIYTLSLHDALPISAPGLFYVRGQRVVANWGPNVEWPFDRSEEHTSELQSQSNLVCRLLLEKKKNTIGESFCRTVRISSIYIGASFASTAIVLPTCR